MRSAETPQIYSVSEINALVRELVEENYPDVAVTGEISNFKRHSSGHLYFSVKDAEAQLRVVCFRSDARNIDVDLRDGLQVVVRGRLTVYEGYGSYQIVAYSVAEAGEGALEKALRKRLAKLEAEGLFDSARKKPLPPYPQRIAVITSPTGAAIRDVLSTIERRWPCADVLVIPVRVQGELAAPEIVRALGLAARCRGLDVVILGRGGGSLEDLWAFNEEAVARAIFDCPVPVISAVGHESDVTVSDFVADVRAATPTMAAELAVPRRDDVLTAAAVLLRRLSRYATSMLEVKQRRLEELLRSYALGQVRGRIESSMQRLDYGLDRARRGIDALARGRRAALDRALATLQALSPRDILSRGYTICTDGAGRVLRARGDAISAGAIRVTFHDGAVAADVKEKA